jgi:hypothetical protein
MKPLGFFETSDRAYKNIQHKIPDDLNRQKYRCEEVTSWKTRSSLAAIIIIRSTLHSDKNWEQENIIWRREYLVSFKIICVFKEKMLVNSNEREY